jgi:hypothetical protein
MKKVKNIKKYLLGLFIFFAATMLVFGLSHLNKVFAEDDEGDDEDEYEQIVKQTVKTETIYVKMPDKIVETPITTTRHDSDGDGLYDDEDPYPTINKFYIVSDANLNGIDDRYEQLQ